MEVERLQKLKERLKNVRRIFLDTAPVIYYVEKNDGYLGLVEAVFNRIDEGLLTAATSPITLAECLIHPYRLGLTQLQIDFYELIVNARNTFFTPLDKGISQKAAQLRAAHNISLTDAFQLSSALAVGCEAFLTNDLGMKGILDLDVIVLNEI
jgi:predicted nucleic acid-binding protein